MSRTNVEKTEYTPIVNVTKFAVQTSPSVTHPDGSTTPVGWAYETVVDTRSSTKTRRVSRGGVSTPGYGTPSAPRPLPRNRFSYTADRLIESRYYSRQFRPGSTLSIPLEYIIEETPTGRYTLFDDEYWRIPWGELYDNCTTKLRNNIRSSSFNAAQAYAERKMTANTIASTARMIAQAGMAVKRGDVMGAARALGVQPSRSMKRRSKAGVVADSVANRWLEVQYGWKPLLQDVYGSMEQLARSRNNRLFYNASASVRGKFPSETVTDLMDHESWTGTNLQRVKRTQDLTIKMGVRYEQSCPPLATAAQLGITNPALLAWELLPFSFVADWFLPVGNFLSSLDATLGLTFLSGYSQDFRRMTTTVHHDANFRLKSDASHTVFIAAKAASETIRYERFVMTDFPSAVLPHFKNPVSTTHAANAIALLVQTFKR